MKPIYTPTTSSIFFLFNMGLYSYMQYVALIKYYMTAISNSGKSLYSIPYYLSNLSQDNFWQWKILGLFIEIKISFILNAKRIIVIFAYHIFMEYVIIFNEYNDGQLIKLFQNIHGPLTYTNQCYKTCILLMRAHNKWYVYVKKSLYKTFLFE